MKAKLTFTIIALFLLNHPASAEVANEEIHSSAVDDLLKKAITKNSNDGKITDFEFAAMKTGAELGIPVSDPNGLNFAERIAYRELLTNKIMIQKLGEYGIKFTDTEVDHLLCKIQISTQVSGRNEFQKMKTFYEDTKFSDSKYDVRKAQKLEMFLKQRQTSGFYPVVAAKLQKLGLDIYSSSTLLSGVLEAARALANKDYNIYVLDWDKVPEGEKTNKVSEYEGLMHRRLKDYESSSSGIR